MNEASFFVLSKLVNEKTDNKTQEIIFIVYIILEFRAIIWNGNN